MKQNLSKLWRENNLTLITNNHGDLLDPDFGVHKSVRPAWLLFHVLYQTLLNYRRTK